MPRVLLSGQADAGSSWPQTDVGASVAAASSDFASAANPHNQLAGQIVYLDFDGQVGVTYDGPVKVSPFDVPVFDTCDLSGDDQALISSVESRLNASFAPLGVSFTSSQPQANSEYTTIYIGGDGSAFDAPGTLYGLAEHVDHGNTVRDDQAFVFSDVIPALPTLDAYAARLAAVIAHETGHLLGFEHAHGHDPSDELAPVAFKVNTHVETANDVRRDLIDDGKVTLDGRSYDVHPRIVEAIRKYPAFYYGGAGHVRRHYR